MSIESYQMEQSIAEREFVGNTLFAAVDRLAERRGDELGAVVESGRPLYKKQYYSSISCAH